MACIKEISTSHLDFDYCQKDVKMRMKCVCLDYKW